MAKSEESKCIVGLEIGTSKVVAVAGQVLPDGVVNVIGVTSFPSKGIDKGSITDLEALVGSVKRTIEHLEVATEVEVNSVTLAISGEHIQSLNENGAVPIADGEVTQNEIDSAMHIASSVNMGSGLSVLHVIPQEYAVDKQKNIKNPLGLQGVRLTANAHLIACHQDWLTNLKKAVERTLLKVDNVVFSGLASSYSVLSEEEKDLGVCLIDIGAGVMEIMVYTNGALRFTKVIPYAGNIVTNDIAQAIATPRQEAENIKVNYGCALNLNAADVDEGKYDAKKVIEVPSIGGRPPRTFNKKALSIITSARYKELLNWVQNELTQLKYDLKEKQISTELIAGVVLTGGGAQIEGITECASRIFGAQVRVGKPLNITGLSDRVSTPQYATVLGLLQYSYYNDNEYTNNKLRGSSDSESTIGTFFTLCKKFVNKVRSEF